MAKRTCACCGKEKYLEGGKTCEKGHFICKECVWSGSSTFISDEKSTCPLCKTRLR